MVCAFRCRKRDCDLRDVEIGGFYSGTFFEETSLTAKELFILSFCWCLNKLNYEEIQRELSREGGSTLSTKTIVDWMQFFRCVLCSPLTPFLFYHPYFSF